MIAAGCALALALLAPAAEAAPDPVAEAPPARTMAEVLAASSPADWLPLDPENTLYLELASGGRAVIVLAPEFAPRHVANVKTLVRAGYFDGLAVLRSQDNYVVQWGDPAEEPAARRPLGEAAGALPPEFDRPPGGLPFTPLADGDAYAPEVGFSGGFPAARDSLEGRTWLAHCYGMVGAGRDEHPGSGSGAELYVVIGHAPRHLDRNVTLLGRVAQGMEHLSTLPRGSGALGFYETGARRVPIRSVSLAADLPPEQREDLEALRTDSPAFAALIASRRHRGEPWFAHPVDRIGLCNVPLPVRPPSRATPSGSPPSGASPSRAQADDVRCPEQAARLAAIRAALERRPEDATLHYYLAMTYGACGDAAGAAEALERAGRLGDGFLPVPDLGFEAVGDDPAVRDARAKLAEALPRRTDAEVAWRLRGTDWIPEGIAYDSATGRLFVGSMARDLILVLDGEGRQEAFAGPEDGLGQILGLAVDRKRGRLLAVDAGDPAAGEDDRPDAVVEIDLATGVVRRRLETPSAGGLNDVTAAPDGMVFASDTRRGTVWRAAPGASALEVPWPDLRLPGANGLAVSAGGDALYVAHSTGIGRVALATGEVLPLIANDTRETLGAIDGLYLRGDSLIGVQNVTNPGRVIEVRLDAGGTRAVAVETLLSHHHPDLAEPTTGALAGDRFLLLANSYVARLQPDGTIRDPETVREPVILALPLD